MNNKKLFLTSFPSGKLILVEVLGENKSIKDGVYIKYPKSNKGPHGTDTTTNKFLFDVPEELKKQCALYIDYKKDCQALKDRSHILHKDSNKG